MIIQDFLFPEPAVPVGSDTVSPQMRLHFQSSLFVWDFVGQHQEGLGMDPWDLLYSLSWTVPFPG